MIPDRTRFIVKRLLLVSLLSLVSFSLAQAIGDFVYSQQISPESGADTSFIYSAEAGASAKRHGLLVWRCLPRGLTIILFADQPLTGADIAVRWAFDGYALGPPQSWARSSFDRDVSAKLTLPQVEVASFTARAEKARSISLRLEEAGDQARYTFPLSGLSKALERLPCASNH